MPRERTSNTIGRRRFLVAAAALACLPKTARAATTQTSSDGFFTLGQENGRWWFLTPERRPFFSLALNHIDSTPLRGAESISIWRDKYRNSTREWLERAVRHDLLDWGFNSVGWVQEVVTRQPTSHRHSRNFVYEEYQWLDLPYCHMLPFADFHQWEQETKNPDFFSVGFEEWCDYVARSECSRFAGDPKLIGYFYIDCPTWVHIREFNQWKGPLFDPEKLSTEAGRAELKRLASRYYQVTHDAIRRYDPHHLILGDRYEMNAPLPAEVVEAAAPYVDVLSFQDFAPVERIRADLAHWHETSGKPVLLADSAGSLNAAGGVVRHDADKYAATLAALRENPGAVGFHLCGAYLRNQARKRGLRDDHERPDEQVIAAIHAANRETQAWADRAGKL